MPTYRLHHLTRYSYEDPVSVCHNMAHLLPRPAPLHVWHQSDMDISPVPAVRAERTDYFGNRLVFFAIQEPHIELDVTTRSLVEVQPRSMALPEGIFSTLTWEQVRRRITPPLDLRPDIMDAFQFAFPSPYIKWSPEVHAYAAESFKPDRPIMEAALDFTARIFRDFKYDKRSTTVSTTLPEIMTHRRGVCQDFAHLQIGGLRSLGLAARYVSGYLVTAPPAGKPRLIGADASHAWVSLFVPDIGWIDLDPTNNIMPAEKHITLAWGRDFGDVSPLRGVILGGGRHSVDVSVDVSPVE